MKSRKIHFIGIGGVGMAALAYLMKCSGDEVSGCDLKRTRRTDWLEKAGIPVAIGHSPEHVESSELVIVTPAVAADNPELLAAASKRRFRGEVLAGIVGGRESIAVCGSHGKTTTSTFIAKLLLALGEKASWAIGGETGDFPVAGYSGADGVLVVEADESDGTLGLYHPSMLVVTNCEWDHPDHFPTKEDYFACFSRAKSNAGFVIEGENLSCNDVPEFRIPAVEALSEHNRRNARMAVEVALRRGHSAAAIAAVLPQVVAQLPDRRFQIVWPDASASEERGTLVTDYAHHPTEMRCAIGMARALADKSNGKLRVLFQPHRYSRTRALLADFPSAFTGADEVVLLPTYAAFERPVEGGSSADIYRECRQRADFTATLFLARDCDEAWAHARNRMRRGDVTLLLGAGDLVRILPTAVAELRSGETPTKRTIPLGAGSNTWKSDLDNDETYVHVEGPIAAAGASLGIPWMTGIPGTIGGWLKMNAGAFGRSIGELVKEVKLNGRWIGRDECRFAYRSSALDGIVEDVHWDEAALQRAVSGADGSAEDFAARRRRFPAGTHGSVFRNPDGDYAGRLLEAVGAKEMRVGGAYVWSEHANVIVSGPDAVPSDYLALAQLMRDRVSCRLSVELHSEVCGLRL